MPETFHTDVVPGLLPWLDIETTGLESETDHILEIGMTLTDENLKYVDSVRYVVGPGRYGDEMGFDRFHRIREVKKALEDPDSPDYFVAKMHDVSGLWWDVYESSLTLSDALSGLDNWLHSYFDDSQRAQLPLCGSSVGFDRKMIEAVDQDFNESFHYRNIDVSSIKETFRRFAPSYYAGLQAQFEPQKKHRTLEDLEDSIKEFSYYVNLILAGEKTIKEHTE